MSLDFPWRYSSLINPKTWTATATTIYGNHLVICPFPTSHITLESFSRRKARRSSVQTGYKYPPSAVFHLPDILPDHRPDMQHLKPPFSFNCLSNRAKASIFAVHEVHTYLSKDLSLEVCITHEPRSDIWFRRIVAMVLHPRWWAYPDSIQWTVSSVTLPVPLILQANVNSSLVWFCLTTVASGPP